MTEHPFDPSNPFDATCERIRREVVQLAIDSEGITIYRELSPHEQIECLVAGVLTGLIGSCFAAVKPDGYDYITDYIVKSVPAARKFAEQIKTADSADASAPLLSTQRSSPAATIGDIPSEPRPPASAAMGLSAGGERRLQEMWRLPQGVVCKCPKMQTGPDGGHWCCTPPTKSGGAS